MNEHASEPQEESSDHDFTFDDPNSRFAKEFGPNYERALEGVRAGKKDPLEKPGPTEDAMSRTNLSLDGLNPDFHLTEAARARIAAIPEQHRIPMAEELIPTPEQIKALSNPETLTVPETGQQITALKVNWLERPAGEPLGREVTVVLPAFLADPTDGPAHETVRLIAMQMPDRPVLAIAQPKLTPEQRQALDQHNDLGPTADAMLEAMVAAGVTDINVVGRSMGAWTGSTIAARAKEHGITVHQAIFIEAANAGVSGKDIAKGFIRELTQKYPDLYHANPHDPDMAKAARQDGSKIRKSLWEAGQLIKPLVTGRARDTAIRYPKGMAGGSLEDDLQIALSQQPGMKVTLVNGGNDPISTNQANDSVAEYLNHLFNPDGEKSQNPVSRIVHAGAPHSNLESAKDAATIVHQRLDLNTLHI